MNVNVGDIIHLLDSAEPDIRFVLQMEADVGRIYYAEITK